MNYLSEVKGRSGTVARVVTYSQAENSGTKLLTFEYEASRSILAELNTHGITCRNAESSRAVPIKKRIEMIRTNPFVPIVWGSNQAGMVAGEEIDVPVNVPAHMDYFTKPRDDAWRETANVVADLMEAWDNAGYHKQIVNRIGEAFTTFKGVITATEWDNFFHLRRDKHADPAIKELADCMWKAKCEVEEKGLIEILKEGEWHTPYVEHSRHRLTGELLYWVETEPDPNTIYDFWGGDKRVLKQLTLEEALRVSSVACGQVSFRKLDTSEETVERVWNRLMGGEAVHASVTQHQGSPMEFGTIKSMPPAELGSTKVNSAWTYMQDTDGISHLDKHGNFWSAQFKHWIMFRKTIPNEVCNNYIPAEEI